ncbi:MAG: LCP family protein [Eggerthellaceae bacterium]|nr:LCP family protein [Eggerthellaceae bacterium]MCH4220661.1 LCP family protein [Eggerthellaceae bacterium]
MANNKGRHSRGAMPQQGSNDVSQSPHQGSHLDNSAHAQQSRAQRPRSHAAASQRPNSRQGQARPTQQFAAPQGARSQGGRPQAASHQANQAYRPVAAPVQSGQSFNMPYGGDGELTRVRKKRHTHRGLKRTLIIIAIVLLALIGGAGAYAAWYSSTLSNNMALSSDDQEALDNVLTPTSAESDQQQPFYVLVIGSDKWENYGERSDAMILTRIDPTKHTITMVSIPRDYPYMLNGQKNKINAAFSQGGPAGAVTAVEDVTGVQISHYVEVDFQGLAQFVDSMGGIYVDVPYTIDYQVYTGDQDTVHIDAGYQRLDGTQCVALSRMRTAYNDTEEDAMRQYNVRAMASALLKSIIHSPVAQIPSLVQQLSQCVTTDISLQDMTSLATNFAQADNVTLYSGGGVYEGDIDPETGLWLCYEDPQGWADLMAKVDAGEDPKTSIQPQ